VNCTLDGPWQNKANCPKRGTGAVSRLRVADFGLRIGGTDFRRGDQLCQTNPISGRVRRDGASEDGGRVQVCETNSICPLAGVGREPVLSLPKERPTHKEPRTIVQNKANFAGGRVNAKYRQEQKL
jgi:hypothetical protein